MIRAGHTSPIRFAEELDINDPSTRRIGQRVEVHKGIYLPTGGMFEGVYFPMLVKESFFFFGLFPFS